LGDKRKTTAIFTSMAPILTAKKFPEGHGHRGKPLVAGFVGVDSDRTHCGDAEAVVNVGA